MSNSRGRIRTRMLSWTKSHPYHVCSLCRSWLSLVPKATPSRLGLGAQKRRNPAILPARWHWRQADREFEAEEGNYRLWKRERRQMATRVRVPDWLEGDEKSRSRRGTHRLSARSVRDPTFLCARLAIWASSHPRPINSPTLRNRHPPYPPPLHRRRRRSARLPTLYPPLRHLAVSLSTLIPSSLYLSAIRHVAQDISTNPPRRPPQRLRLPLFITTSQVHGQRVDTHSIPSIRTCSRERSQGAFRSTIPLRFKLTMVPFISSKKHYRRTRPICLLRSQYTTVPS